MNLGNYGQDVHSDVRTVKRHSQFQRMSILKISIPLEIVLLMLEQNIIHVLVVILRNYLIREKDVNKEQALQKLDALEKEAQVLRKIIEAPEKTSSLLEKPSQEAIEAWQVCISSDDVISGNYYKAFKTFILLRQQEGSEPPKDGEQWCIVCNSSTVELYVSSFIHQDNKINRLIPSFKTVEYAQKAINFVGEENIIHMFKTFHGIYDE